jgi:hypothetical protein
MGIEIIAGGGGGGSSYRGGLAEKKGQDGLPFYGMQYGGKGGYNGYMDGSYWYGNDGGVGLNNISPVYAVFLSGADNGGRWWRGGGTEGGGGNGGGGALIKYIYFYVSYYCVAFREVGSGGAASPGNSGGYHSPLPGGDGWVKLYKLVS